ncbi:MAG: hypothetical protein Q8K32_31440 [Archangium sp.]|nr:hypothetical protein [Archangium sp.]
MTLSNTALRRLAALELLSTEDPLFAVALPFRVESRANDHRSNHWGVRAKTSKAQREGTYLKLSSHRLRIKHALAVGSLVVRVVRVAPTELDSHDNLGMALKSITDGVADAIGLNDRDESVTFIADSEVGPWGARVEFYEGDS